METQTQQGIYRMPVIDNNLLQVRLNTQELISQVEDYLRGAKQIIVEEEKGRLKNKRISIGKPKANDLGVQSLLNWISSTVNPHTVQGNFPVDKSGRSPLYDRYICEYQIELGDMVIMNLYDWEISEAEIPSIIANIMLLIQPFMTRTIDNGERNSYGQTMKTQETNIVRDKNSIPLMNN